MKLMDEVAGIVAARHCKTNIVTASVDAINFHDKIRKGNGTLLTEKAGGRRLSGSLCPFAWGSRPVSPAPWCLPICQEKQEASLALVLVGTSVRLGFVGLIFQSAKTRNSDVFGAFMLCAINPS